MCFYTYLFLKIMGQYMDRRQEKETSDFGGKDRIS